jgi:bacteriocin-like protein
MSEGETMENDIRELTETELDEVSGGVGQRGGVRIGTGSCFQWVPSANAWYACNLLGSDGLPLPPIAAPTA